VKVPLGRQVPWARSDGGSAESLYELVGPEWFVALVDRFYAGVADDELLRPLYPADLTASRLHMAGFLKQYWGGPADYSAERGHPRLRMRHAPFRIGAAERDAWLGHMAIAVDGGDLTDAAVTAVMGYFQSAAEHLVNHPG
jgi:hemoglobin|tara:strand:- start:1279 stop:1701 length:423 start_codon:yes stop_codon:yes gene_type:complete